MLSRVKRFPRFCLAYLRSNGETGMKASVVRVEHRERFARLWARSACLVDANYRKPAGTWKTNAKRRKVWSIVTRLTRDELLKQLRSRRPKSVTRSAKQRGSAHRRGRAVHLGRTLRRIHARLAVKWTRPTMNVFKVMSAAEYTIRHASSVTTFGSTIVSHFGTEHVVESSVLRILSGSREDAGWAIYEIHGDV